MKDIWYDIARVFSRNFPKSRGGDRLKGMLQISQMYQHGIAMDIMYMYMKHINFEGGDSPSWPYIEKPPDSRNIIFNSQLWDS